MRIQEVANAPGRWLVIDDRHPTGLTHVTIQIALTRAEALRIGELTASSHPVSHHARRLPCPATVAAHSRVGALHAHPETTVEHPVVVVPTLPNIGDLPCPATANNRNNSPPGSLDDGRSLTHSNQSKEGAMGDGGGT